MWITHSYVGTTLGGVRCLSLLLYEDYREVLSQFGRELDLDLERFAGNLRNADGDVRPFAESSEPIDRAACPRIMGE